MALVSLLIHFVSGGLLVLLGDLIATWNYDRERVMHWTERARTLWPARVAGEANLILVPLLLHVAHALIAPASAGSWVLNDTAAFLGAGLGGYWLDRLTFPRLDFPAWRDLAYAGMQTRFLAWIIPVFVGIAMPAVPGWQMLALTVAYLTFHFAMQRGAGYWLLERTGHVREARTRLVRIVADAAAATGMRAPRVRELRSAGAQAYALITLNELLFTDRLVDLCSDEELKAICHHELAHLSEPAGVAWLRQLNALAHLPLLYVVPLVHLLDSIGLIIALLGYMGLRSILPRVSRKMEKRADRQALAHEADKGSYALALLKIHEDNLIPAVTRQQGSTHPHLYDRLVDAGLTPDFERPSAPASGSTVMFAYSVLLGMGAMWLTVHQGS